MPCIFLSFLRWHSYFINVFFYVIFFPFSFYGGIAISIIVFPMPKFVNISVKKPQIIKQFDFTPKKWHSYMEYEIYYACFYHIYKKIGIDNLKCEIPMPASTTPTKDWHRQSKIRNSYAYIYNTYQKPI